MKRRNLFIVIGLYFLVYLAIVTNLPEQRDSETSLADREQTNTERYRARVNSAIAAAEAKAESFALQPYVTEIKTREVAQVQRRTPTATERYAGWIEEYGRDRAGEMIQEETKQAFESKDFKRVERLTNAQATAMRGDYERSRIRNSRAVSRVSLDGLQVGNTYTLSRQSMLMPEGRNPVNA